MSDYVLKRTCRFLLAAFLMVLLYLFTTNDGATTCRALSIHDAWMAWAFCVVVALVGFFAGIEHQQGKQ